MLLASADVAASIDLPPSPAPDRHADGGGGAPAEFPAHPAYSPSVVLVDSDGEEDATVYGSCRSGTPDGSAAADRQPPQPALVPARERSASEPLVMAISAANAAANAAPPASGCGSPGSVGAGRPAVGAASAERPPHHSQGGSRLSQQGATNDAAGDGGSSLAPGGGGGRGGGAMSNAVPFIRPRSDGSDGGGGRSAEHAKRSANKS